MKRVLTIQEFKALSPQKQKSIKFKRLEGIAKRKGKVKERKDWTHTPDPREKNYYE